MDILPNEFMKNGINLEEINNKWLVNYKAEDRPTSLMNHINWLKDIGFGDVDVVWKYYIMQFTVVTKNNENKKTSQWIKNEDA